MKAMLISLGKVTREDLDTIQGRFEELDVNGDRTLSVEDLVGDVEQLAKEMDLEHSKREQTKGGGKPSRKNRPRE